MSWDEITDIDVKKKNGNIVSRVLLFFMGGVVFFIVVMLVGYLYILENVPKITSLSEYSPALVTKVFSKDGKELGEFYQERRYLVPIADLPKLVVNAFISAEDESFFEHTGINPKSILRAFIANTRAGKVVQGGSTITQQVAKSLLLTSERRYERKIKEAVLASHMERHLTKNEILYLYLNQIYLGHGAYGVAAAAKTYFKKEVKELTIAESALLAGLVPAPSKYDPLKNPRLARQRQAYVLNRMFDAGFITQAELDGAKEERIFLYGTEDVNLAVSPYYVEHIRQYILEKYGQEMLYKGGMKVFSAADYELSLSAQKSVRENLHDLDKRQGYRGPIKKIRKEEEQVAELKKIQSEIFKQKFPKLILPKLNEQFEQSDWVRYTYNKFKEEGIFEHDLELIEKGKTYPALVTKIENDKKSALLLLGSVRARINIDTIRWAKKIRPDETRNGVDIRYIHEALYKGDLVMVKVLDIPNKEKIEKEKIPLEEVEIEVTLEQEPKAQGALISMEIKTGKVVSMVGGYDFTKSEYNRALQGERQVGSAFKPFIYSAALDKGYTPASIIVDSPIIFENQGRSNLKWTPENNSEMFYGDTTLRTALIKSRNVPSVKLLQDIEIPYFIKYAKRVGIQGDLPADLSIALGSNSLTLMELTKLYSLFPRGGLRINPVFVLKVEDRHGSILEEFSYEKSQEKLANYWREIMNKVNEDEEGKENIESGEGHPLAEKENDAKNSKERALGVGEALEDTVKNAQKRNRTFELKHFDNPLRAMDEKTAFLMSHLLQEVVQFGTGAKARALKTRVGGKTGTTNEYVDAWFVGFSPEIVTGVWSGFDAPKSMGKFETGARTSLPAWVKYMKDAAVKYPLNDLEVPRGIVFVRINSETGKLAANSRGPSVREAFVEGTEPTHKPKAGQMPDSNEFFQEDF